MPLQAFALVPLVPEDQGVAILILCAAAAGAVIAYRALRPRTRRRKQFDAGAVSQDWIQQHRGESDPWR